MILRRFTDYILQGRLQAMGTAFVFGFVPLLGTVSILIAAFITLRKGVLEGLLVLVAATLPLLLEYMAFPPQPDAAVTTLEITLVLLASNLLTWLFAAALRKYSSWSLVLQLGALLGIIAVCAVHIVYPDIASWWHAKLTGYFSSSLDMMSQIKADDTQTQESMVTKVVTMLTPYATGWVAIFLIFNSLLQVFLARWWQASIFNPGGLKKELYQIRMSQIAGIVFFITLIWSYWGNAVILDIMPILFITFAAAGFSLLHYLLALKKHGWIWLGLIYLVATLVPESVVVISIIALLDISLDFRKRAMQV
jgi:hypothetical protein